MSYTAQQLITRAYYLSGVVARRGQAPSGDQITDGLYLLNELLDFKAIEVDLIPYWQYNVSLDTVPGQELYFIPNCVAIEEITFNLDVVRYSMTELPRSTYFGSCRVDNVETLPFTWNQLRVNGGLELRMYFLPNTVYPLKFIGKFALTDVNLSTDVTTVYDNGYLAYLRYELAKYICMENTIEFNHEEYLAFMRRTLMYVSPPDLTMQKTSMLQNAPPLSWSQINIGRGFTPSSY